MEFDLKSGLFNSLFECEDGKEYLLKNESLYRLYKLGCKKLNLGFQDEKDDLTELEQKYLMSEELDYFDFKNKINNLSESFKFATEKWNLDFFKRYLIENKDTVCFTFYDKIIELFGYEYIFHFKPKYLEFPKNAFSKMTNIISLNLRWLYITDISALSNLTSLQILYLDRNQIEDISALSNLTSLQVL